MKVWGAARGPLVEFLAYNLVLIIPFIPLRPNAPEWRYPSLIVYKIVLIYSGSMATYYLLNGSEKLSHYAPFVSDFGIHFIGGRGYVYLFLTKRASKVPS